jgi:predicted dehydrogenase
MSAPVGVAVVGLGVGEQHARAFAADNRARLLWVYDLDAARARRLGTELGAGVATGYDAILADPAVQVVSIASFDDDHFSQALEALCAGKHVFVEKPLCMTRAQLAELKKQWSAAGGRLQIGSNLVLRTAPGYVWLRERMAAGELGTLYAFDGDYLYGRLHKITEGWRAGMPAYSVMLGGAVHLVDLLLWLTGQRPRRVTAVGNRLSTAGTSFAQDDFRAATLEFDNGLVARITANFGCVHRHHHVVRAFGTRASFLYDDAGPRLHSSREPSQAPQALPLSMLPAGKGLLIPRFLDAVRGDTDYASDTQSFFDGISVCLASDEAAASGTSREIEYA